MSKTWWLSSVIAIAVAASGSGCSIALERHRALGVVADLSVAAGAAMIVGGETCTETDGEPLGCLDALLEEHYAAPALIGLGVLVGLIGIYQEASEPVVKVRARPALPRVVDPETKQLAELARAAAETGDCATSHAMLAQIAVRDAVYGGILVESGAITCR